MKAEVHQSKNMVRQDYDNYVYCCGKVNHVRTSKTLYLGLSDKGSEFVNYWN